MTELDLIFDMYDAILDENQDGLEEAIANGADPDAVLIAPPWRPLDFALARGVDFVRILVEGGADLSLVASGTADAIHAMLAADDAERLRDMAGCSGTRHSTTV